MSNKYDKYFKILELDIQASKEDVKKAFSELSHIWHPDNYMGKPSNIQDRATRKFKKISTAYQVLNEYLSLNSEWRIDTMTWIVVSSVITVFEAGEIYIKPGLSNETILYNKLIIDGEDIYKHEIPNSVV